MTQSTPNPPPKYSEAALVDIIKNTKDLDDLCRVAGIINELSEAGDFPITFRLKTEIRIMTHYFVYGTNRREGKNKN